MMGKRKKMQEATHRLKVWQIAYISFSPSCPASRCRLRTSSDSYQMLISPCRKTPCDEQSPLSATEMLNFAQGAQQEVDETASDVIPGKQ
jgi:hypothetical protein